MSHARQIAFDLLCQVQRGTHPLDHWLDAAQGRIERLGRADRAMVHAMVYGTLRWQGRLDHIIDHWSKNPGKIEPRVRIILRMALLQHHYMDRVPDRAIVHSAVELAKRNGRRYAAGFVNGLLRRILDSPDAVVWPDDAVVPDQALAARMAFPRWLMARWIERWGMAETERLCAAINSIPEVTLRVNTLKADRDALMAAIAAEVDHFRPTCHVPEGIVVSGFKRPFNQWPSFLEGWFQIQDEAAQLVAHLLNPKPGEAIWDACAGLGTKTAHLAQLMGNRGTIVATDRHGAKLERLAAEMQRLGISIVQRRIADLEEPTADKDLPMFDRILVDAPCSGLGVLRKNPDGKWHSFVEDLDRYRLRQLALLGRTAHQLRPGGMLVFAVCSMEPEENEAVVELFLQKHMDFAIFRPEMTAVASPETILTHEGYLKTMPHRHGMDGFFAAGLVKQF
ncbi:MAG: 16S rRNA (cytosine(967)-C(5))-methyltransferase RsmB [Desulfatitalea sp.]|nr:16S rRNA (cytosine(967)-C(5))-methyltransferase RsmB [Desulfatitalea sp.]